MKQYTISVSDILLDDMYEGISDASIQSAYTAGSLPNTMIPWFNMLEDTKNYFDYEVWTAFHAQRVAAFIDIILSGVKLDPITIEYFDQNVAIVDGNHRIRAIRYLVSSGKLADYAIDVIDNTDE